MHPGRYSNQFPPPVFHVSRGSFSFPVNADDPIAHNLRRTSLTGQQPHRFHRQLSGQKLPDYETHLCDDIPSGHTSHSKKSSKRGSVPIPVEHYDAPQRSIYRPVEVSVKTSRNQKVPAGHNQKAYIADIHHLQGISNLNINSGYHSNTGAESRPPQYEPTRYTEKAKASDHLPPQKHSVQKENREQPSKEAISETSSPSRSPKMKVKESKRKYTALEEHEREIKAQDVFVREKYKLYRFNIIPDGNCLYRAVAQAVLLDQKQHEVLRQLTIDHIREHKEEFKEIIEGDTDHFLVNASLEGVWAGYPEILAMSRWLDININITTGGSPSNPTIATTLHYFPTKEDSISGRKGPTADRQSIWLSWLSSGHYDTFVDKLIDNIDYDNWVASRDTRVQNDAILANELYAMDNLERRSEDRFHGTDSEAVRDRNPSGSPPSYDSVLGKTPPKTFQNRPITQMTESSPNLNNDLFGNNMSSKCPGQIYPSATYPGRSKTSSVTPSAPHPDASYISSDEQLARALELDLEQIPYSKYYA